MAFASALGQVPAEVFDSREVFVQVLQDSWALLDEAKRAELLNRFLPSTLSGSEDQHRTVELLLTDGLARFDQSPLSTAFGQLKVQRLAPDLTKTIDDIRQLKQQARRIKEHEYQVALWKEVMAKKLCLLNNSLTLSANEPMSSLSLKRQPGDNKHCTSNLPNWNPMQSLMPPANELVRLKRNSRVRERYLLEMRKLADEDDEAFLLSTDEDSNDSILSLKAPGETNGPAAGRRPNSLKSTKTQNNNSSALSNGVTNGALGITDEKYFKLLKNYKRKRKAVDVTAQPLESVMQVASISVYDIINRVTKSCPSDDELPLRSTFSPPPPTKIIKSNFTNSSPSPANTKKSLNSTKKKIVKPMLPGQSSITVLPELLREAIKEESSASLPDSVPGNHSALLAQNHCFDVNKKENMDVFEFEDSPSEDSVTVRPLSLPSAMNSHVTATVSITTPSAAALAPVSLFKQLSIPIDSVNSLTVESQPASFFSLLRDIFLHNAPMDNKLTLHRLEELVRERLRCFEGVGWSHEMVQSAMNFLSGALPPPDNIPLVDYKEKNQQWQWIGIGRDSDDVLLSLNEEWVNEKDKNSSSSLIDPNQPVPPPIYPTEWTVRGSTEDERKQYHGQEHVRYNNPHKAFTFKLHSYQSVVGPVKGCGSGSASVNNSSPNKAREHSLLINERPPIVTLLSLVRDAAARLPNGEGTRADICELLKDSQYILPNVSDQQINGIVSGALDRLHYEKDPCVKYDVNRKVWIYLHRNRTEQDFERLHQQQMLATKAKRNLSKLPGKVIKSSPVAPMASKKTINIPKKKPSSPVKIVTMNSLLDKQLSQGITATKQIHQISSQQGATKSALINSTVTSIQSLASEADEDESLNRNHAKSPPKTIISNLKNINPAKRKQPTVTILPMQATGVEKPISQILTKQLASKQVQLPISINQAQVSLGSSIMNTQVTMIKSSDEEAKGVTLSPSMKPASATKTYIRRKPATAMTIVPAATIDNKPTTLTQAMVAKPIQIPITQNQVVNNSAVAAQLGIPNNLQILNGRPGSLVLATSSGKSFSLVAGSGSLMLQPHNTITGSTATVVTTTGQQGTPITIRGGTQAIKLIQLQNIQRPGTGTIIAANQAQQSNSSLQGAQIVARVITGRPGQPTQAAVLPPNSSGQLVGVQPVILTQPTAAAAAAQQQPSQPNSVSIQSTPQPIAISIQPQKVAQPQVTTVSLPNAIQSQQKR